MAQATYQLDRRFPIAVVRLSGELSTDNGRQVTAAVLESLVEEPTTIILDLAEVTDVDHAVGQTLRRLAARAAHWPGASLLLASPPAAVSAVLQSSGITSSTSGGVWRPPGNLPEEGAAEEGAQGEGWPAGIGQHADDGGYGTVTIYPTFAAALAVAAAEPVPLRMHRHFESTVQAPRAARELAADACTEWELPSCVIPTEILASELVTNAVRHAGTAIDVRITLQGRRLRVSVHDRSPRRARLHTPSGSDDHGRGLLIVSSVAAIWGSEPVASGKVVWASLEVAPAGRTAGTGWASQPISQRREV